MSRRRGRSPAGFSLLQTPLQALTSAFRQPDPARSWVMGRKPVKCSLLAPAVQSGVGGTRAGAEGRQVQREWTTRQSPPGDRWPLSGECPGAVLLQRPGQAHKALVLAQSSGQGLRLCISNRLQGMPTDAADPGPHFLGQGNMGERQDMGVPSWRC